MVKTEHGQVEGESTMEKGEDTRSIMDVEQQGMGNKEEGGEGEKEMKKEESVKKEDGEGAKEEPAAQKQEELGAEKLAAIKERVEFYFMDSNFRRDKFLRAKASENKEGFVKIDVLLTFNKLKTLTTNPADVVASLAEGSNFVEVSEDKTSLRRTTPLPEDDDSHVRTVFVEGIPKNTDGTKEVDVDEVIDIFKRYGPVAFLRLARDKHRKHNGIAFVEFSTVQDAEKAIAEGQLAGVKLGGKDVTLKMRKYEKSKPRDDKKKRKADEAGIEGDEEKGQANGEEKAEPDAFAGMTDEEIIEKTFAEKYPRYVRFVGVKDGTTFHPIREQLETYGHVKFVNVHGDAALAKFEQAETASKFLGESAEVTEVDINGVKLKPEKPSEEEVKEQMKAKLERRRVTAEGGRQFGRNRGGGRWGRGGHRGRGFKRGKRT